MIEGFLNEIMKHDVSISLIKNVQCIKHYVLITENIHSRQGENVYGVFICLRV